NKTFREFLSEVKEKTLSCFENQAYQYEELIEELSLPRDTSRNPLFDVMFSYINIDREELVIPGLTLEGYDFNRNITKFDLSLTAGEIEEGLYVSIGYSTELFSEATIDRFIAYFERIVEAVTTDFDKKLSEIDILSFEEREQLLQTFNDTSVDYPREQTLIALFEEQVQKTPANTALIYEDQELSYEALDARSNQLSRSLLEKGCCPGMVVGLMVDRSIEMMVGMLAIMKTGAAYLPLGTDLPEQRVVHM
ncbi:condensation domain-containing protein, partial [Fulvivirga imtechensis]|uniref:condensation domain-containing protein n=1 Tax=Fulvivirga imtechensis TaxID=881893 RepID=UPI00058F7101